MKIGIDGFEANQKERVGIGQFAFQMLRALYSLNTESQYTVFLPEPPLADLPMARVGWDYQIGTSGALWTVRELPFLIGKHHLDLFFSPTHYAPWFVALPKIISIMDLSYIHFPGLFRKKDLLQLRYMGAYAIKRAQKILTISEFSKKEIIEYYHYPENNIDVVYPGIDKLFTSGDKRIKDQPIQRGVAGDYILFVGTIQPRKNLVRLFEAFERLEGGVKLVIAGKKGWLFESILQRAHASPKKNEILFLEYVTEAELAQLYHDARCFVLPSLYEGFGIPVVEAMAMGCPVVVANTSSLPEIAGEAGVYVHPDSSEDIANGLRKALQLKGAAREKLVTLGKRRAQQFTWEKAAKKALKVFKSFDRTI